MKPFLCFLCPPELLQGILRGPRYLLSSPGPQGQLETFAHTWALSPPSQSDACLPLEA